MQSKREIINDCIFKSKKIENVYSSKNILKEKFEKDTNYDPNINDKNIRIKKKIKIFVIFILTMNDQLKTIIITVLINLFLLIYNFIDKPTIISNYSYIFYYDSMRFNLNVEKDCKSYYLKYINSTNIIQNNYCNSKEILNLKKFNFNNFFENGNTILIIIIIGVLFIIETVTLKLIIQKLIKVKNFIIFINFIYILFKTVLYLILIIQFLRIQFFNIGNFENNIFILLLIFTFLILLVTIIFLVSYNFILNYFIYLFYLVNIDLLFYSLSNSIDRKYDVLITNISYFFLFYIFYSILIFAMNLIIFILKIFKKNKKLNFIYFNLYSILILLFNFKLYYIFQNNMIVLKYHYIFEIFELFLSIIYFILFYLNHKSFKILIKNKKEKYEKNLNNTNFIEVDFPKLLVI